MKYNLEMIYKLCVLSLLSIYFLSSVSAHKERSNRSRTSLETRSQLERNRNRSSQERERTRSQLERNRNRSSQERERTRSQLERNRNRSSQERERNRSNQGRQVGRNTRRPTAFDVQSRLVFNRLETSRHIHYYETSYSYSSSPNQQRIVLDDWRNPDLLARINSRNNSTSTRGEVATKDKLTFPSSGEWIRLRGNNKMLTSGLVQVYRAGKWGYVCDDSWDIDDGSVACRQMGFTRGAYAVTGISETLPKSQWDNAEILMDETHCTGTEKALHLCQYAVEHDCSLSEVAAVLCYPNKGCPDGWMSGYGKCYSFYQNAKDIQTAENFCAEKNASLVSIQSQSENHFLSNTLKNLMPEIHQWYTSGRKFKNIWKWSKLVQLTNQKSVRSRNVRSVVTDTFWFPGWPSVNNTLSEPKDDVKANCLTLSDEFETPIKKTEVVDYFFWKADVCQKASGINFICQTEVETKPTEDCYTGTGSDYRGFATRTEHGSQCLNWADSYKANDNTHPGKGLGDHNYCRNPDNDTKPWCWTDHIQGLFGFCSVEKCSEVYEMTTVTSPVVEEEMNCPPEEFFCSKQNDCIPKAFHCDKEIDCDNGEDEENCEYNLDKFQVTTSATLQLTITSQAFTFATYINVTEEKCAKLCIMSTEYICRSFVYSSINLKCNLSQYNTLNGSVVKTELFNFYELVSQRTCAGKFQCANGYCVAPALRCDGNNDCIDFSDELECKNGEKLSVSVSLVDGNENSGTVQVTYMGEKGVICDDLWTINDAHVVCRMLGYRKAEKTTTLNYFKHPTDQVVFLLDDVKCHGNEESIENCTKSQWKHHDCKAYEIAGVVCLTSKVCASDQFKCKNGGCLQADMVCDKTDQCGDRSDEQDCVYNEFKLVNGSGPWEGRVEVIRNGLPGTVCSDHWDEKEVAVICLQMGFRYGGVIASKGKFGKGSGPIWLDNMECQGTESSLSDCQHAQWGVTDCDHSEDIGVVCHLRRQITTKPSTVATSQHVTTTTSTTAKPSSAATNIIVSLEGGSGPHEGIVTLVINQRKYYICDDKWDENDATVVCRMLNFSQGGEATVKSKFGDTTSTNYILDDVNCAGSETDIKQCYGVIGTNKHDCHGGEQAGVICRNRAVPTNQPSTKIGNCGFRPLDHKDLLADRERRSINNDLNAPRTLSRQQNEKIIGGVYAQHGAYPWQVRVDKVYSSRFVSHHCGAVIISEHWLLSAAHCFAKERKSSFQVTVGDHNKKEKDQGEQVFSVEQLLIHGQYIEGIKDYDIALIKIKPVNGQGIHFNDYVQPACLPDVDTRYDKNENCMISGWGRAFQAKIYPDILKSAKVPIIDQKECYKLYNNHYTERSYTDRMICAGYREGGIDTCDGDSGGPLVCNFQNAYTVFGITSWGAGCAQPGAPGVYANVKVFLPWIKSTIDSYSNSEAEKYLPPKP
uniref:Serine protease 12 n=1 Tax=Biomphalaria glabrata TaxID=6526 RepID=A0A2C9JRC5_BIOGL